MLKALKHFSKHCSNHFHVKSFGGPYIDVAVGNEWEVKYMVMESEEWGAVTVTCFRGKM